MKDDIIKDKLESRDCILADEAKIKNLIKNVANGYGTAKLGEIGLLITLPNSKNNFFYYGININFLSEEDIELLTQ